MTIAMTSLAVLSSLTSTLLFPSNRCLWIYFMGKRVQHISELPDDAWRTHIGEKDDDGGEMQELAKKSGKHA